MQEQPRDLLAELNLERDTEVRFRHKDGQVWRKGKVVGFGKDLSLTLVDDWGHMRAIMPEKCQRKQSGPRGGTVWVDVVKERG